MIPLRPVSWRPAFGIIVTLLALILTGCGDVDMRSGDDQQPADETPVNTPQDAGSSPTEAGRNDRCNHDDAIDQTGKPERGHVRIDPDLMDEAEREGSVSVIVTLDIPYAPEPELDSQDEIDKQRERIAAAQDELVASLEGHEITETTRYELFPQIVLTVDHGALLALSRSPLVESVDENVLDAPSG